MVKPSSRKKMAYDAVEHKAVSIRFACAAFQISETCYRYQHRGEDDNALIARMRELEAENSRLKKMYAEERLKAEIIQEAMAKKW